MHLPSRELHFLDARCRELTAGGADAGYRNVIAQSPTYLGRMRLWRSNHPSAYGHVCGSSEYQLHHRTYERFGDGAERDEDLVPLCATHHNDVHSLIQQLPDDDALLTAHDRVRKTYRQAQIQRREAATRLHQQRLIQAEARSRQRRLLQELVRAKQQLNRDPDNERLVSEVQQLELKWSALPKVAT